MDYMIVFVIEFITINDFIIDYSIRLFNVYDEQQEW
jgi:hypothetical protein